VGTKRYPYDEEFQDKVVALLLREPSFLPSYASVVDHRYFENEYCRALVRLTLDYFFETDEVPTREKLGVLITDYANRDRSGSGEYAEMLRSLVSAVYKADLTGINQITETVIEFGQVRSMEAMTRQMADMVAKGEKSDAIWELVDRARSTVAVRSKDELDIGANFMRAQELAMESGLYNPALKIKTYLSTLDDCTNGGIGRKELATVLAPTGSGKSTLLVNMGAAALYQRQPVIHISVTELETVDLIVRYSARLTGISCNLISSGEAGDDFKEKMAGIVEKLQPELVAHRVPPGTSVSSLRSFISRWTFKKSKSPALVIIDNADDLSSRFRKQESYDEKGEIYAELKDLAHDYDCAIWADSQTNRQGGSAQVVHLEHIADSHKKARKADVIVSLSQTESESEAGICRLKMLKARRSKKNLKTIRCTMDGARMWIREAPEGASVAA
jgi:replicative DNA helicase